MKIELTKKEQSILYIIQKILFFLFASALSSIVMGFGLYTVTLMNTIGVIHSNIETTVSVAIVISVWFFVSTALFDYYKK